MIELRASQVVFYSQKDEDIFIDWVKSIPSLRDAYGERDSIVLVFENSNINDDDLRELIALYTRYCIVKKPLAVFLSNDNQDWFRNPDMFWAGEIFGS